MNITEPRLTGAAAEKRPRSCSEARSHRDRASLLKDWSLPSLHKLPGRPESCWTSTAGETFYPRFEASGTADIGIVGAGIVGLTAAYLLTKAGLSVSVLEARRVGRQVTGRSTAKITTQHSLIYRHLIETFDLETAKGYADANRLGMQQIQHWVEQLEIACDFEAKDAYAYSCDRSRVRDLEAEADAARRVGIGAELLESAPLPFKTAGALRFRHQAQFNPAQYLVGLARGLRISRCASLRKHARHEREGGRRMETHGWNGRAPRRSCRHGDEPADCKSRTL